MATIRKRKGKHGWRYQVRGAHIESRTFDNQSDAKVYMQEEERRVRLGEHYVAPQELFGGYTDAWLERKSHGWAPRTYTRRLETRKDLRPLDKLHLNAVNAGIVDDLIDSIVARGAPRQAQLALQMIKAVLHSARARRHRVDDAVFEIPNPRYEPKATQWLTIDQVRHLASFCGEKDHRIILLAAYTGMRQSELMDLKTHHLHLDDGYLEVLRGKTTNSRRTVYLIPPAVVLLQEQLLRRAPGTDYVFPAVKGGRWDRNDFMTKVFRPAREAAGMPEVTFHALRHSFVSLAAREGLDEDVIAEVTGWSRNTVSSMMRRYRHVYSDEVKSAIMRLEQAVAESGQTGP